MSGVSSGVVVLVSEIGRRRVALLGVAVVICLFALPAIASAEPAQGSTETLTLSASFYRAVGAPFTITAEGTADGLHRLFVYGEANGTCTPWPYEESTQKGAVWLSNPEGEPLGAGHFSKTYNATPRKLPSYDLCAYLDTTPSGLPDDFAWGCLWIPEDNCYFPSITAGEVLSAEKEAKRISEATEAERKHRVEAEQAQHRTGEEVVARQAREETERRQATEETERKALEAKTKRCTIPQLRRYTLAGVRRLLWDANCRLGRVTTRNHGHGTLFVKSQNPQHGKTFPQGSAVSIVLGLRAG